MVVFLSRVGFVAPPRVAAKPTANTAELRSRTVQSFGLREGLPRTLYRRCADARARIAADLAARIGAAVTAYRAGTLESPVVRDLFEAYEEAGDDLADPEVMKTIVNTVIELMWAGTGTTAHTMGSVAQLLAAHPQWFERAQREQDRLQAAHGPALTGKARNP